MTTHPIKGALTVQRAVEVMVALRHSSYHTNETDAFAAELSAALDSLSAVNAPTVIDTGDALRGPHAER